MRNTLFVLMALDGSNGGGTLTEVAKSWAPDETWVGVHGDLNFDLPSPTADGETLGQTIQRLGDDIYREIPQFKSGPNLATKQECSDLAKVFPSATEWFNQAMNASMTYLLDHDDPFSLLLKINDAADSDTISSHPVGDINPRYANLVGDIVSDTGSAQMGRVTSTTYPISRDDG